MSDYSAVLCVNFKQLEYLNQYTGDCDASILYAAIRYQVSKTKIKKNGKSVIARTREQLSKYVGGSIRTVDRLLSNLRDQNLVSGKCGMWYGKKRMFLSAKDDIDLKVNIAKLQFLNKYTGSNKASILLSYIAYQISQDNGVLNRKDGRQWVMRSRKDIAHMLRIDGRTSDSIIKELVSRGVISSEGRRAFASRQYVLAINQDFYDKMCSEWGQHEKELKEAYILTKRTKVATSNKNKYLNTREILKYNNTYLDMIENTADTAQGDIILSKREESYLKSAMNRTIERCPGSIFNRNELWGWLRYAVGNSQQRKGVDNFVHCVNRLMYLIRNGDFRRPFGYNKYTESGVTAELVAIDIAKPQHERHREPQRGVMVGNVEYTVKNEEAPHSGVKSSLSRLDGFFSCPDLT